MNNPEGLFPCGERGNPMVFVQWLAVFMILTTILLVPKRSVQVIDLSDPGAVWVNGGKTP
ncbi:hypothetical protein V5015_21960 [Enterobacter kobei]|uniref:hypothetical protein n=1 Tax=Enterobacter kobei TaxID=208224 RepID=UPI003075FEB1